MVGDPGSFNGAFDGTQSPVVHICELADCATMQVAEYTTTSGPGSETVRVVPSDEHYIVNWDTDESAVASGATYRISVLVAGTELGFTDVEFGASGREARDLTTNETIGLKDGRTLPIKFRIEEGAVFVIPVSEDVVTVEALEGTVTLELPPGALGEETGITVEAVEPTGDAVVAVEFGPEGLQFAVPVPVTIGYDPLTLPPGLTEDDLAFVLLDENDGRFKIGPGGVRDEVANTVTAPLHHFSTGGAGPAELAIFCPDGNPDTFETLPEALDAVIDGGTVEVCDGTHTVEDVAVSRPVTIRPEPGATPTLTTLVASRTLVIGGYASGTVLIEGLTIAMTSPQATGFFPYAIRAQDPYDQLVIRNVTFNTAPASWGALRALATSVPGGGVTLDGVTAMGGARGANVTDSRLDITNNSHLSGFSRRAVQIARSTSPGRIENSTFAACGSTHCIGVFNSSVDIVSNTFDGSLNIGINSTVLIDDNDISGCGPNFCVFGGGTGTFLTVTNNRIDASGADPAILLGAPADGGLIENNVITGLLGTFVFVEPGTGPTTVQGNTCSPSGCSVLP
jgi:hypothetical protein